MAAGAVARALGLPLFRVDLAGMVSKYIGETEKNLDRLFAAADHADVVLFFDEADAIFGQRSEVQDSHDRYANLEVSYLLQRLEAFEGVSILATNLAQNIDAAFLRRIDMVVEFPAPSASDRRALWARGLAGGVPAEEEIDLDLLAGFELTGGEIRNCWLWAAHLAARQGGPVGTFRLLQAVWAELAKQGRP
ncbi:ATP-binding protein, partial [Mangrovicoccus ximenensis]|uniref:ATP-binding protein n=1 Tax=Mangrovicoccus ximenensis TaxID=1911570 RepID=UPI0011AEA35C